MISLLRSTLRSQTRSEEGFTLLETIIAMTIMVLALSTILAVESGSINASLRTKQMNIVGMLAKRKMVSLEHEFEGKTFEEYKKEQSGAFEAPYSDYSWKAEVKEIEFPSLSAAGASGAAGQGGQNNDQGGGELVEMITKLVTKFLSKAVREVSLTVTWNSTGSVRKFTVSTYWVDLNHEFELTP